MHSDVSCHMPSSIRSEGSPFIKRKMECQGMVTVTAFIRIVIAIFSSISHSKMIEEKYNQNNYKN